MNAKELWRERGSDLFTHEEIVNYIPEITNVGLLGIVTYYARTIKSAFVDSNSRYKATAEEEHTALVDFKVQSRADQEVLRAQIVALENKVSGMSEALIACRRESVEHEANAIITKAKLEQLEVIVKGLSITNGQTGPGINITTG